MARERIWTKVFISLFLTNMAVFLVFYGLVSTLPLYVKGEMGRTDDEAGLLMSIFLLSAIVVRPFTGILLDRFGKRKMLWISLFFYLLCTILYAFIHSFYGLLLLRFFQGIWFSVATTASGSLATDHVPAQRRGEGLGYYAMSTNLAIVLGPFIALFFIQAYSFQVLFYALSILMAAGSFFALAIPLQTKHIKDKSMLKISLNNLFEKNAVPIALLASLVAFSYSSVLSYLSIYAQQKHLLAWSSTFFVLFAAVMLLTRPFTGRLYDLKGPKFILIPGFFSFMIGFGLLAFVNSVALFLASGVFIGFGYGAIVPSLQTLCVQSALPERSGYATATYFTFFDIGVAIGSYLLGLVALKFGYQHVYLLAGAVILVVFFIYYFVSDKSKMQLVAISEAEKS